MLRYSFFFLLMIFSTFSYSAWHVNCENYCSFREFPNNCQGVYFEYPDGYRNYSLYNSNYRGCYEALLPTAVQLDFNAHVLNRSGISCNCPSSPINLPSENTALTQATRDRLVVLREQIRLRTMCAPSADTRPAPGTSYVTPFRYDELRNCYSPEGRTGSYVLDEGCEPGLSMTPAGTCNYHGDSVGGMGWLCKSGEMDRCRDIANSQDPVTGAWYRNTYLKRFPSQYKGQPYFSRDMGNGVMSYLLKTRDRTRALKWLRFLASNPKHNSFFNLCPPPPSPRPNWIPEAEYSKVQFDDRCHMVPTFLGTLYKVLRHIGLENGDINRISSDLYQSMIVGESLLDANLIVTAETVPSKGASAYQATLAADEVGMRIFMGQQNSTVLSAARILNERTSKINPRFHWLAQNGVATEYGAYLIQKYCKPAKPKYGIWASSGNQRAGDGNPTGFFVMGSNIDSVEYQYMGSENSWRTRNADVGHECIGWINLYLGNADRTTVACRAGESMVDGACQVYAFPKPSIVSVAGLGYMIDSANLKILYGKVNYTQCPYGGAPQAGGSFCELSGLIPPRTLVPGKNYWIENSNSLKGIYSTPDGSGNCSSGETRVGSNCRALSFSRPSPMLYPNIEYTVSGQAGAQGVYYQSINGSCSYGGTQDISRCWILRPDRDFLNPRYTYFIRRDERSPGIYRHPEVVVNLSPIQTRPRDPAPVLMIPGASY